jgi:predicted DNA-binding transcriptional regulator YafY
MSQRQQLERIMAIDQSIRNGEYPNADRLAKKLEVSRRVIFNDREFMINRLGAPIEYDRQRGGWYYTNKTWILPGIIVSEGELLAFFLSVEISKRFLGSSLESPLRSAVEKISRGVKGAVTVDLDTLSSHFTFSGPSLIASNERLLLDIQQAIAYQQCIWMRYFTAGRGEYTERKVMPYHIHNYRGDWFLIGYDTLRNDFRIFLVGRIDKWKVLPERFERDETFNASEWIGNAFQLHGGESMEDVSIWFGIKNAQFIRERQWHASQTIEERADGSLVLHMKTGGLVEVRNWVLQFGSGAEVLAPESLRKDCISEIEKMNQVYNEKEKTSYGTKT